MQSAFEVHVRGRIQGQMLRLSEHHAVAIYLRDGQMWVADFIDGQGELVDATTWFRFNCGTLANSHALRRMAIESATPISSVLAERIDALHRARLTQGPGILGRLLEALAASLPPGRWLAMAAHRVRRRRSQQAHSAQ
jgi:hypothetical protein